MAAAERVARAVGSLSNGLRGTAGLARFWEFRGELNEGVEAKTIFLELTQRQPHLPEPYNNLAAMYAAAGEYEQAIEVLKLALRTHPSHATAFENLTKVYGKLASEAYDRALGRGAFPPVL